MNLLPPYSSAVSRRLWLCAVGFAALHFRVARAEDAVSYKFQDYAESAGRVGVRAHYALIEKDLTPDLHVKLQGVIDSIAGATPTGEAPATPGGPVPLTNMHDRRKAWNFEGSRQFSHLSLSLGFANSRESDYVSNGFSLNTLTDLRGKNTQLLLGAAGTSDDVKVYYQAPHEKKHGLDLIVGVNQLINAVTSVSANLSFGRSRGYLGDPYRIISKNTELLPGVFLPLTFSENRPRERDRWTLFSSINHAFREAHAAVEGSYRLTRDDFGMTTQTLSAEWLQKIGDHVIVGPTFRFYQQTAADFYFVSLNNTLITPAAIPTGAAPFYSSDYRIAKMRSVTAGLKAVWNVNAHLAIDAAYDRYDTSVRDGITSASAFPDANIITVGAKFSF